MFSHRGSVRIHRIISVSTTLSPHPVILGQSESESRTELDYCFNEGGNKCFIA